MELKAIHDRLERIESSGMEMQETLREISKALGQIAVLEERQLNYKETMTEFKASVTRAHERIDVQDKHLSAVAEVARAADSTAKNAIRATEKQVGGLQEKLWKFAETILIVVLCFIMAKAGLGGGGAP